MEMNYITPEMDVSMDSGLRRVFDNLTTDEYSELKESISQIGIQNPIIIWEETGIIVDGMHRYRLGIELGVPIPYVYRSFDNDLLAKQFMFKFQLGRRNLDPNQKLKIAAADARNERELAALRKSQGVKLPEGTVSGRATSIAAERAGISNSKLRRYIAVEDFAIPEVQDAYFTKSLALSDAAAIARLPKEQQRSLILESTNEDGDIDGKLLDRKLEVIQNEKQLAKMVEKLSTETSEEMEVKFLKAYKTFIANKIKLPVKSLSEEELVKLKGDELFKAQTAEAALLERYNSYPIWIKQALLAEQILYQDLDVLDAHEEDVSTYTNITSLKHAAIKYIQADAAIAYEKKLQTAKNKEENDRIRKQEDKIIEDKATLRKKNFINIGSILKNFRNGELFCPVHGVDCGFPFRCGLTLEDALKVASENIDGLKPEMVEKEIKDEITFRTTDGVNQGTIDAPIKRIIKVRKEGSFGKLYREEP